MFLIKLLKFITIIALCAAIAWFIYEPGFEPAITCIIILAAIIKLYWDGVRQEAAPQGQQATVNNHNDFQNTEQQTAGNNVSTPESNESSGAYPGGSFTSSDFSGMDMAGYISKKANYQGARFTGANLAGAHLKGSNFENADFKGANLSRAYLKGANLKGANLDDADLSGAFLVKANLRGASIKNTRLAGANMKKTIMPGPTTGKTAKPDVEKAGNKAPPQDASGN